MYRYIAAVGLVVSVLLLNVNPAVAVDSPGIVGGIANQTKLLGETAVIDCSVRNKGSLPLYWNQLGFGQPILISIDDTVRIGNNPTYPDNTTKYDVTKIINTNSTLTYRLTIQKLVDTDAGTYQCVIVLDSGNPSSYPTATGVINIEGVCHTCPRIVTEIGPQTGRVNATGSLSCIVANKETNLVRWKKDTGGLEISSEGIILAPNPEVDGKRKYEITIDTVSSGQRYTLKMNRLTVGDTGTYRCYVVVPNQNNPFKTGLFTTLVPPTISSSESSFRKQEGQSVTMTCAANGSPTPNIAWSRPDGGSLPDGSLNSPGPSLTIDSITKQYRGYYRCTAVNGVSPEGEYTVTLFVYFNPIARAVQSQVWQATGFNAELGCIIEGYPDATPSWYKGSGASRVPIVHGGRYTITNTTGDGIYHPLNQVKSEVKINELLKADFGEYSCEGKNPSNVAASATITLTESDHCMGNGCPNKPDTPPPVTTNPGSSQCTGSHCAGVTIRNQSPVSVIFIITALISVTVLSKLLH